jgi:uncharacterized delta-60 repeat protein
VEGLEDRAVPSAGALDPTFSAGGTVTTSLGSTSDTARGLVQQADGKIVVVGSTVTNGRTVFGLARYLPGGGLDGAFGTGGVVRTSVTTKGPQWASAATVQADGKIVVVGTANVGQSHNTFPTIYDNAIVVARYNSDGSLDKTFNKSGALLINPTSGDDEGKAVAVQSDGKILIGGWTNHSAATGYSTVTGNDFFLARVTASGTLDSTFGSGGMVSTDFCLVRPAWFTGYMMDEASAVMLLPDGKILAAGDTVHGFALARYNANGSLDTAYGTGGLARLGTDALVASPGGPDGQVGDVSAALQPDGKVALNGSLYRPSIDPAAYDLLVARADAAGNPDPTFGTSGLVTFGIGTDPTTHMSYNEWAGGIGLQSDGSIVVGGTQGFTNTATGESGSDALLVRFTPAGALDGTFGSGGSVTTDVRRNDFANALVVQSDGKIVQAGSTDAGSDSDLLVARHLPSAPQIGSFTASQVGAGAPVTLTAANITDANPNATVRQVDFYYFDSGGNKVSLGTATQGSGGAWSVSVNLTAGTYTVYAQATDSYGVLGDAVSLTLTVS